MPSTRLVPLLLGACLTLPGLAWSAPMLGRCEVFPDAAVFNVRIDDSARFPAHPDSARWIQSIGGGRRLHADWGRQDDPRRPDDYFGIPWNLVTLAPTEADWPLLSYDVADARDGNGQGVPDESDCAVLEAGHVRAVQGCDRVDPAQRRFPFAIGQKIEHGDCDQPSRCGDRHVLVLDQGACRLWESFFSYRIDGVWRSYATASWDLRSMAMRPDRWTSADAAGLPILPLLARVDEASAGVVGHALRVTLRDAILDKKAVWPARHVAGRPTPGGVTFGALMRLKADVAIPADWTVQARALARAMREHGLYVADIGSDLYVQGDPSAQWQEATIRQLQTLRADAFEFVDLSAITRDARFRVDSFQARW